MAAKSSTANGKSGTNPFLTALAADAAKEAGLRYYSDSRPGIRRARKARDFIYLRSDESPVRDVETLARIKRLAIPPAWRDVWICPVGNGHIQATGRDDRNRKQYRYHHDWRSRRDENKYERIISFARALPAIRRRVQRDLKREGMPREKILATIVRLLETTLIRVGNDEYARHNQSYGLTTMHDRHVKVVGPKIAFSFKGKSGKKHEIDLHDRHLARIVKRCQDLPGQELFAYEGEEGRLRDVTSQDVNAYLREISGDDYTAKDFRTWAGTVLAARALREFEAVTNQRQAKRNIVKAIEAVAATLGNTPAVCRKCYIHPAILNSYLEKGTIESIEQRAGERLASGSLKPEERMVLALLQGTLERTVARRSTTAKKQRASAPFDRTN